eukprot:GGOE01013252.1.p1 GENE.GGOE01013252.1~~GGOE01013252.1.p1  ORF type:complete len:995 (-),score=273.75 GGOE01013252.1:1826-4810(-)
MRLTVIFLAVLAVSILLTSMAAWGITFGTSYSRVTTMSSEFTALAQQSMGLFDSFVMDVLQENVEMVDSILAMEWDSGEARIQETKATMSNTIGALVNYTTNATDQSLQQMNEVVDKFGGLMGLVISDFKGVATNYSAQLRAALAAKASTTVLQTINARIAGMKRFQTLSTLGMLNLSRAPWDPIGADDCMMLGVLCATAVEIGSSEPVVVALATGRSYSCTAGKEASISTISFSGAQYNEQVVKYEPDATSVLLIQQRCLSGVNTSIETVGQNCSQPPSCGCGQDKRCTVWYQQHAADTSPNLARGEAFRGAYGAPATSISYSVFNTNATNPSLLAVATNTFDFTAIDRFLSSLVSVNTTVLAVLLNDTNLTSVGSTGVKCAANEIPPGDPSLPTWAGLRSCDSGLRTVAGWLAQHPAASTISLESAGVVWDVFPTNLGILTYYFVIGSQLSVINAVVDVSEAHASSQLTAVRMEQLSMVAASGKATKTYMASVGTQNAVTSQAMEANFIAQMQEVNVTSRTALASSQQRSAAQVRQLMDTQTTEINALTSRHLSAMAVTTGWTIAVVMAILLIVMLCSAVGTVRITRNLAVIIGLMEDVAEMRVEDLAAPPFSYVTEVARIGTAFQVLVRRLGEYKSYIPAGVFEKMQEGHTGEDGGGNASDEDRLSVSDSGSTRQFTCDKPKSRHPTLPDGTGIIRMQGSTSSGPRSGAGSLICPSSTKDRAAALSFHVFDLTEALLQMAPALAKSLLSQCVAHVHEAASQGRGNVDFVAGDRIFVTFNAHIPCPEPANAAVNAALEMRRLLWNVTRERLKFQIGISYGRVLAGSVGYAKFRSMTTLGNPVKVATVVSQMTDFESGTILVDTFVEEKMKYVYELRPVELVHFPEQRPLAWNVPSSFRVFLVQSRRQVDEDEWLYQVDKMLPTTDWQRAFDQVVSAKTVEDGRSHLEHFLEGHPQDAVALRLKGRLTMWTPGLGLPLWVRAEHDRRAVASAL